MQEIKIEDKQKYLNEHYLFAPVPKIEEKMVCAHCDSVFTVGDYRVYKDETGFEAICCPNAPECKGTIIDWVSKEE